MTTYTVVIQVGNTTLTRTVRAAEVSTTDDVTWMWDENRAIVLAFATWRMISLEMDSNQ